MKSVCFISLGCPKNQVDSEVMLGGLTQDGFVLRDDPATSEIIIINTCGFIEDAKKESIDTILEMSEHKKTGSCRLLVVAGCLPQRYKGELAKSLPEVDLFLGVGDLPKLVESINKHVGTQQVEVGRPDYLYDHASPRVLTGRSHAAYVKIAEGCFHGCSFCVIPRIRGKYRSRPMQSIVSEVDDLLSRGVREINLIAQDSTAYGGDLGDGTSLAALLEGLVALGGDKWIRLLYAYPHGFPEDVVSVMRDYRDVVKYIDIPIQHASQKILKSMRREGDAHEMRRLFDKLRYCVPDICLRTSVIVGYPGETEDDFAELLDFVCETKFENLGAFVYSPEEDTVAAALDQKVPRTLAMDRCRELMSVQQEISYDRNRLRVGKTQRVLVEGASEETEHLLVARHAGQAPDVDGVVYINEGTASAGEFATVEITEAHEYDLIARIV